MIDYNNCRWAKPDDLERMCLNFAVDLVNVDDEICKKCSQFFSYIEEENKRNDDNITDNLIGDLE